MLCKFRAVVRLQELLNVTFSIQDFTVYTVVGKISLVTIVLRCSSAYAELGGKLCIGKEAFASEQRVLTFSQIQTFGGDVVRDSVKARDTWVGCSYEFFHAPSFPMVINPATS